MAGDELNDPLGVAGASKGRPGIPPRVFGIAALVVGLLALGLFLVTTGDPHGGEPYAVATITPPPRAVAPPPADPAPTSAIAPRRQSTAAEVETESGVKVVRPGGSVAPDAMIIEVPPRMSLQLAAAPDPRLVERTHFGLLPRIGADGARPRDVYARPVDVAAGLPRRAPRIAIVVGGVGLNEALSASAIADLPAAVTLGIAPYGADLDKTVARARAAGHEVILQVPMAAFDGPAAGPHMLQPGVGPQDTLADLHWLMGRFTGYVGIGNFQGAKFTADPAALTPVIQDVADRGLLYFDDGSSARSVAPGLAAKLALPFAQADVILDDGGRSDTIDAALLKLEARARDKGVAIGMASDLPTSVERIARFARGLEARGIALVPLSATASSAPDVAKRSP